MDNDEDGNTDCDDDGCAGSPDCPSGEGEGEGEGEACEVVVSDLAPTDGATGIYIHDRVSAWVTEGSYALIKLYDDSGTEVYGTQRNVATVSGMEHHTFTPFDPLSPDTTYAATVYYCDEDQTDWGFTTSSHGEPLGGCDPTEAWYGMDPASAHTDPLLGAAVLGSVPDDLFIGVGLDTFDDLIFSFTTGPGEPDICREPAFAGGVDLALPQMSTALSWGYTRPHGDIATELVVLQAHYSPDCSNIRARLALTFDVRNNSYFLPEVLGTADPDEACSLLEGTHTPCQICEDGGERYCVEAYIDNLQGPRSTALWD